MKHIPYFNEFLNDHVNLNPTRLDKLENCVDAVTTFLSKNLDGYNKYSEQGSYAHRTIIKPVQDNDTFDADLLVFINDDKFSPIVFNDYVNEIYSVFKENETYRGMVTKETRCVKLKYAGDFRLDIVPCIEYRNEFYICNRKDEKYEKTDGDGYKEWLNTKNSIVGENNLKKATRLFKFLRDHKDNFSIKSILLTTLLGNQINEADQNSADFSDLPTTLKTLSNRLNDYLKRNSIMPIVENPVLSGENFNRHWDQQKYENFRNKFDSYNTKINDAFLEQDHNQSIHKWRKLFGDDFGKLKSISPTEKGTASVAIVMPTKVVAATKPHAS